MDEEKKEDQESEPTKEDKPVFDQLDGVMDRLYKFAMNHKVDAAAYVALVLGIIISFFNPTIGGSMVGVIFGLYYGDEVLRFAEGMQTYIDQEGSFKPLIMAGTLLCLLFALPFFFFALALVVAVKAILDKGS